MDNKNKIDSIIVNDDVNLVKLLIDKNPTISQEEILVSVSKNNHLNIVKFLVENGVDIHTGNEEALVQASKNNHFEIIKFLIENGADIHAQNNEVLKRINTDEIKRISRGGYQTAYNGHLAIINWFNSIGINYAYDDGPYWAIKYPKLRKWLDIN